jgi:catechol 2,3-dioxygenase-like lactoylglutathione lyase family enzyme
MGSVSGFDHVAITVADVDATIDFYCSVLGAELLHEEQWRSGQMPIALIRIGANRMSLHPVSAPAKPHAIAPTPGSADLCFRWEGSVADAIDALGAAGVAVEVGPVPRPASNGERGESVYFRDPDGNLLELLTLTS